MTLIDLIKQHSGGQSPPDFSTIAATIRGLKLRQSPRGCGSVETAMCLAAVGVNWAAVMEEISKDATGRFLLDKLAQPDGIQWAHPLTQQYLATKKSATLTQAGIDAIVNLSSPLLYDSLTAAEVEASWRAEEARQYFQVLQNRRQSWDVLAAEIRSRIESGSLADNAAVVSAVSAALGV